MFSRDKFSELIYNIKYFFRNLMRLLTWKRILLFLGILVFLGASVFLLRKMNKTKPEDTSLYSKSEINVGIVTGTAFAASEEGQITGFEKDLAERIISDIYPDATIRFVEIVSQEASYKLRTGEIDLALGMFSSGPVKTQGMLLSSPYYTDNIYAYIPKYSANDTLFALTNKRVRILSSEITKSSVSSMFKKLGISVDLHLCTSVRDGIDAIKRNDCVALVAPEHKMTAETGLKNIDELIGTVTYRIMFWNDQKKTAEVINEKIESLRKEGFLNELSEKYIPKN